MSTVQQNTPKASRRTPRQPKQNAQHTRSAMSETEAYPSGPPEHDTNLGDTKQKSKRKPHANKRDNNNNHDSAVHSDGPGPRSANHSENMRSTPIKQQAYAGPTFHHSPAASTLPIPKYFLAKSLPNTSDIAPETDSPDRPSTSHNVPPPSALVEESKRESTPLDFLFDAARKAKTTPGSGSPYQKHLTPAVGSPLAHSPAGREGETQFPFEYDSADTAPGEGGSVYSTPLTARFEAVRSNPGTPEGARHLEEAERKAKAAALKDFLKSPAQSTGGQNDNSFNARPAPQNDMHFQQPGMRHYSNPTSPMRNGYGNGNNHQYFPPMAYTQNGASPGPRPPGSNLRNIYSPDLGRMPAELSSVHGHENPRISTARNAGPTQQHYGQQYEHDQYNRPPMPVAHAQEHGHQTTPSAQQLEDDLRRVLKIGG